LGIGEGSFLVLLVTTQEILAFFTPIP